MLLFLLSVFFESFCIEESETSIETTTENIPETISENAPETNTEMTNAETTAITFRSIEESGPLLTILKKPEYLYGVKKDRVSSNTLSNCGDCVRPRTWMTTMKGETRDFFRILQGGEKS